ncbi:hypothetical protein QE390_005082 [Siphonobacter sp. SORGH_AS 1065]|nr:hypothetical protein [Siphonobacter sp. SORGH_AS_1065]
MTVNSILDREKSPKHVAFRWRLIEAYRIGLISENQILQHTKICRTCLRGWNRDYQLLYLLFHVEAQKKK